MRKRLEELREALLFAGESKFAEMITAQLEASDKELLLFLASDDLWGGSGSIADQAGGVNSKSDSRRRIETALIELGNKQISSGVFNHRTKMWVSAFTRRNR